MIIFHNCDNLRSSYVECNHQIVTLLSKAPANEKALIASFLKDSHFQFYL